MTMDKGWQAPSLCLNIKTHRCNEEMQRMGKVLTGKFPGYKPDEGREKTLLRYIAMPMLDYTETVDIDYIDSGGHQVCERPALQAQGADGTPLWSVYAEWLCPDSPADLAWEAEQIKNGFLPERTPEDEDDRELELVQDNLTEQAASDMVRQKNATLDVTDDTHDWHRMINKPFAP